MESMTAKKRWLRLLSKDLDIRWGKPLRDIQTNENSITLTFEDGTQETGDLLLGSEGAHSPTRDFLLGKEEAQPMFSSFSLTALDKETALALRGVHPIYCIPFHPNETLGWASIHDTMSEDPAQWVWMITQTLPSPTPTNLQGSANLTNMKERGKQSGSPDREVLTGIPKGASVWHSRLSYWPIKRWDIRGGKIRLLGNAAYPMTFHRSQELNNAFTYAASASQYRKEMKEHTREELCGQ